MKPEIILAKGMPPFTMAVLEEKFTLLRLDQAADKAAFLADVGGRVTAVASSGGGPGDAALMDALPNLKLISCFGVGVDGIDLAAAKARGVSVTNTPDVLTDCVADLAVGLLIATVRQIALGDRYVRRGDWLKGSMPLNTSLRGKKLGIIGLGRIGEAIAERAVSFGMEVGYHSRTKKTVVDFPYYATPIALADASDILLLALPGGAETKAIVDAKVLKALGPKGYLINIARGSVVDEPTLIKALQDGTIAGAGLDVFADEPRVPEAFMKMENVVLNPHQASATIETRTAMGQLMIDNLLAHFAGSPLLTPVV